MSEQSTTTDVAERSPVPSVRDLIRGELMTVNALSAALLSASTNALNMIRLAEAQDESVEGLADGVGAALDPLGKIHAASRRANAQRGQTPEFFGTGIPDSISGEQS